MDFGIGTTILGLILLAGFTIFVYWFADMFERAFRSARLAR